MVSAEVAEWQTRRSQKPLTSDGRVGSNPTFGTKHGIRQAPDANSPPCVLR